MGGTQNLLTCWRGEGKTLFTFIDFSGLIISKLNIHLLKTFGSLRPRVNFGGTNLGCQGARDSRSPGSTFGIGKSSFFIMHQVGKVGIFVQLLMGPWLENGYKLNNFNANFAFLIAV